MKLRRLAWFAVLPCALVAYACSSDEGGGTDNGGEDAGGDERTNNPDGTTNDSGGNEDSGSNDGGVKDGGDAGDGGDGGNPLACFGNPLTPDGGAAPDGGVTLDGSVASLLFDELTIPGLLSSFADGPTWVDIDGGSGALVYSQLYEDVPQLIRLQPDGGGRTVLRPSTNGVYFIGSGVRGNFILTTSSQAGGPGVIVQTLPDGGTGPSIALPAAATNPNDLVIGPKGDIYLTDPQYQNSPANATGGYRLQPDGGPIQIDQAGLNGRVNGVALSPDATTLYFSITDLKKLVSYPVAASGAVTNTQSNFVTTADEPDGIAVDTGGNIWVAEAAAANGQSGRVEVFSPAGKKLGEIPFTNQRPTGLAFGGTNRTQLFITTETRIYRYTSRCAGTL